MDRTGLILDAESISELVELAKGAEDAKLDSVWATELYRTSFQQLSAVAQATQTIKLGTAVALAFVRSPLITALTALDLDEISSGRLILGLGTGAKRTNELWHGVTHGKPVSRIKECIEVIRLIMNKSHLDGPISYAVSNNESEAKQAARATIAFYATVRTYEPPFKMHGFEKEAQKIREAFFKRDIKSMIENVTDDMVETFAIVGDADECLKRINEYREYIDLPILSAPHYFLDFDEVKEYQRAILETFGK